MFYLCIVIEIDRIGIVMRIRTRMKQVVLFTLMLVLAFSFAVPSRAHVSDIYDIDIKGIDAIKILGGISFEIVCDGSPKLEITTEREDDYRIQINDKKLEIVRKRKGLFNRWKRWRYNDDEVYLSLIDPLESLKIGAGSDGSIDNCVVNDEQFSAVVSTGGHLTVKGGQTKHLNINLSTGARLSVAEVLSADELHLNLSTGATMRTNKKLNIKKANIELSTGAFAELCQVEEVIGDLSTGASIQVNDSAKVLVKKSTGAGINRGC